jgi:hypothetical protein
MKRERGTTPRFGEGLPADESRGRESALPSSFVDYAVTVAISGLAAIALPFVDDVSRRLPQYSGALMGGFLAVASVSLAGFWSTRRDRT